MSIKSEILERLPLELHPHGIIPLLRVGIFILDPVGVSNHADHNPYGLLTLLSSLNLYLTEPNLKFA